MTEPAPHPSPRIGTAERDAAMGALAQHLEAGRLEPDEYGERSARAAEARTAEDLDALFVDLPEPHPHAAATVAPRVDGGSRMERWGPPVSAALPIIALILFLTVPVPNAWIFFLLIPLGGVIFARSRRAGSGGPA